MRTIQFKLTPDECILLDKIGGLADYADLTPKQLFMRFIRVKFEEVSKGAISAPTKPKGRPAVIVDGLEREDWIAARIDAYREAEKEALHFEPDHESVGDDLIRDMAETCWTFAEEGKPVPLYLKTMRGGSYTIGFPRIEGE